MELVNTAMRLALRHSGCVLCGCGGGPVASVTCVRCDGPQLWSEIIGFSSYLGLGLVGGVCVWTARRVGAGG